MNHYCPQQCDQNRSRNNYHCSKGRVKISLSQTLSSGPCLPRTISEWFSNPGPSQAAQALQQQDIALRTHGAPLAHTADAGSCTGAPSATSSCSPARSFFISADFLRHSCSKIKFTIFSWEDTQQLDPAIQHQTTTRDSAASCWQSPAFYEWALNPSATPHPSVPFLAPCRGLINVTNACQTLLFHDEGDNRMLCLTLGCAVRNTCLHAFTLEKRKKKKKE